MKSRRKKTGRNLKPNRKKKKYQRGGCFVSTKLGEQKISKIRVRGGKSKSKLFNTQHVNVGGKKLEIQDVIENKANFKFKREKIITKGGYFEN